MTKSSILIVTALLALVAISATTVQGRLVGGRMHIGDVASNKEVQEPGRFSVDNYNQNIGLRLLGVDRQNGPLRFVKVVEAESQVVAGIKYYLKVEVLQGGGDRRVFDAEVVVKPWLPTAKHLLTFSPSTKPLY